MISILVTYYNQEQFVKRSLDSIFNQHFTEPFEVLVGDDGSQDNTCEIVHEYMKQFPGIIKLYIQPRESNKKYFSVERASLNRLELFSKANGEYICFLDGDDSYCDFTWIQSAVDNLKENMRLAGVAHSYREVFDSGRYANHEKLWNKEYIRAKDYCRELYIHAGACVFRNPFIQSDIVKLRKLKSFDDNDIMIYFLNYGDLFYCDEIVYDYYQNENSIWTSASDIERNLINSIDYEILKQIIPNFHIQLLMKYHYMFYKTFLNRKKLIDESFSKYKSQCYEKGIVIQLLNWTEISILKRILIYIFFKLQHFNFIILRVLEKFIRGIKK